MPESWTESSGSRIIIDGPSNLLNELLAFTFKKEFFATCTVLDEIPLASLESLDASRRTLVLIDSKHRPVGARLHGLRNAFPECFPSLTIALYNIPQNSGLERETCLKGIKGFFHENDGLDFFFRGVQALLIDQVWISQEILSNLLNRHPAGPAVIDGRNDLTRREEEVLALIAMGESCDGIARRLFISRYTVKTHLYRIYKKVGVSNRFQAALWAAHHLG